MQYKLLTFALIVLSALCWTSCASSRKATEISNTRFQGSSVETRDTVREQVMVAVHDTIREITTITVQTNNAGDTVKVVQITDRDRARAREAVRDKEERLVVKTDTVYIEKRDSVYVQTNTGLTNPTNATKGSGFRATLKWIFWIIIGLIALTITAKVCLRKW